jgi:hypothetical protein
MRLVFARKEAFYRGFRIEGAKEGECLLLRVIATKRNLPCLEYSRFRAMPQASWLNAVHVVCRYIDESYDGLSERIQADQRVAEGETATQLTASP